MRSGIRIPVYVNRLEFVDRMGFSSFTIRIDNEDNGTFNIYEFKRVEKIDDPITRGAANKGYVYKVIKNPLSSDPKIEYYFVPRVKGVNDLPCRFIGNYEKASVNEKKDQYLWRE